MTNIPRLKKLWSETRGDPKICVAVLDSAIAYNLQEHFVKL